MSDIATGLVHNGVLASEEADRNRRLDPDGILFEEALLSTTGLAQERILRFVTAEFHLPYVNLGETSLPETF